MMTISRSSRSQDCYLLAALLFAILLVSGTAAFGETNYLILLDGSHSMAQRFGDQGSLDTRWSGALGALERSLTTLSGKGSVGVRLFGHRYTRYEQQASCSDSELAIPFTSVGAIDLDALSAVKPSGYTPLAFALQQAKSDFPTGNQERVIILITDGDDTCGGDPVGVMRELRREGFLVQFYAIGVGLSYEEERAIERVVEMGYGSYLSGNSPQELRSSIATVVHESLSLSFDEIRRARLADGDLGTFLDAGFEPSGALRITPGRYADNHIGGNDRIDLYQFSGRGGEKYQLRIEGSTLGGGLVLNLLDQSHASLEKIVVKGPSGETEVTALPEDGIYYLQISPIQSAEPGGRYTLLLRQLVEYGD